ncbi:MAG: M20/M25/M40 family metallo-hydrolase [Steroidobacteraceae bacterium]
MRRMLALACALLSIGFEPVFADEATVQAQLVQFIEREQAPAIQLLERAVNINSGTLNRDGVRAVGSLFQEQFAALGFTGTWVDGAAFHRAGHLVLKRKGKGPRVLLIGHLDTVFDRTHAFQRAERVDEHTLRGPGTADMKGGIVVALTALRALQAARSLGDLDLTLVLNGDEEDLGEPRDASRATLIAEARRADVALGLENAADDPSTVVIGRRSSSHWQLDVRGRAAHSSRIFSDEVGTGAAYELARVLSDFYEQLHEERNLTFSPGVIVGGSNVDLDMDAMRGTASGKANIVADRAIAIGDIRALTPAQLDRAVSSMQAIASKSLPQTTSALTFTHNYPPMPPTPGNERLLAMYDEVSRTLGYGPVKAVDPARAGAADISFAAAYAPMNIDGLGLLGGNAHTAQEFADLRTFPIQTQRLALLLYTLAREQNVRR